jgi:hypothetical protein
MRSFNKSINDVYTNLCKIIRNPQEFGLGQSVPEPLANALKRVLCTLSQIQMGQAFDEEGDLANELSQDADRPLLGRATDNCGSTVVKVNELCVSLRGARQHRSGHRMG